MSVPVHVLHNEHWRVGILPETGASIAFGQIRHGGEWVDFLRPTPQDEWMDVNATASYPLVPWSNRIRDGVLVWQGRSYRLRVNFEDGTAIHGAAREYSWDVAEGDDTHVTCTFDSTDVYGVNWPWSFSTRIDYRLDGADLVVDTSVTNTSSEAFPAGFAHHPYFQRTLAGTDDDVQLRIPCDQAFPLVACMTEGPAQPVEDWLDFRQLRDVGERFIDNCLTGRAPGEPIEFVYAKSGRRFQMLADELYQHVVFYLPQAGKPFLALEPVTNANDAFTMRAKGIPGDGLFVLEPGETRAASFTLRIADVDLPGLE